MIQIAYAVIWWLILVGIGLITFPLTSRICSRLPDRGYSVSKILGLLLLTVLVWLFASTHLIKFGYLNIAISLALLFVLSFFLGRKHLGFKNLPLKSVLIPELLFAVIFGAFLFYLSHKPDLHITYSEDFMDFGFMQSILRGGFFPPTDPWLAGESIPYYYGGHLIGAILTRLSSVPPAIAYNLAVAGAFALAVCAAYGIGYNATKRKLFGFATVIFVCVAGFISGAFQLAAYFLDKPVMGYNPQQATDIGQWFLNFDFVGANWIIFGAVTHYPYYAYLVGDMHANVMDIPFQLMYMTLMLSLLTKSEPVVNSSKFDSLLRIVILGISLGFFAFVNTWSFPIYLGFTILAFLLLKLNLSKKSFIGIIVLSFLVYLPYHLSRGSGGFKDIGLVADKTNLMEFFEIFALPLFAMFSLFLVLFTRKWFGSRKFIVIAILITVFTTIAAALMSSFLHMNIIWVLAPLIVIPFYYIIKSRRKEETQFMLLLFLTGVLVVFGCELFFVNDPLGGDFERYNTILKVYVPIWVVLGVPASYAVYLVWSRLRTGVKWVWGGILVVFVLAALVHPIAATTGWAGGRYSHVEGGRLTLDGLEYLKYTNNGDYEAVRWLNENVKGSHVILEAPGVALEYSSPASSFTGLPTSLGWAGWEVMWRGSWEIITERTRAIDTIYGMPNSDEALVMLEKYNVEYIYVGELEREHYGTESLMKFANQPERYKLVYENAEVSIYQVMR
ncbi:MAG TPA: DUF2298 domain-containing protein [Dehalococcoidia bacterium]|nr:DUF2298 domain-containing protein [Dehalococcoidia bacterium]